ncbi:MAG: stage II sporulation protein R [Clostridia bacterium]|nr:stage II sporulation protein R [Clostridia bacterium]
MKTKKRILNLSLALALIFSVLLSFVTFEANCEDLRENVFRLHIIANSDSDEDQALKIAVRDAILAESDNLFGECKSLSEAKIKARESLAQIGEIAERVIAENGYSYMVSVSVEEAFFDTRVYDDFTLPAGNYEALRVEIGKAEGKNWWCVLFPSICVGAAGKLTDTTREDSAYVAQNSDRYTVRFKIVEWYERLRSKIF